MTGVRLGLSVALAAMGMCVMAAAAQGSPRPVLVELFTSEGCSSCPPADALLRQVNGMTVRGALVIGLGEHVTYWNGLGWTDRFSSEAYTARQEGYSHRFGLDSVYTPQMVVNGRTQFVGSDRAALERAIDAEAERKQLAVEVNAATITEGKLSLDFRVGGDNAPAGAEIVAVLTDDVDRTAVGRGENGGRTLVHAAVARVLLRLGALGAPGADGARHVAVPLPPGFAVGPGGHQVVIFVQGHDFGPVLGVGSRAL